MTEQAQQDFMQQFFLSADQKPFDPCAKFGTIEAESQLIYDNITTAYPLNLPTDYYLKSI